MNFKAIFSRTIQELTVCTFEYSNSCTESLIRLFVMNRFSPTDKYRTPFKNKLTKVSLFLRKKLVIMKQTIFAIINYYFDIKIIWRLFGPYYLCRTRYNFTYLKKQRLIFNDWELLNACETIHSTSRPE